MDSEHISRERNVTLRDGLWRLGRARGTVAARVAVKAHPDFREVAVLASPDGRRLLYAALLIGCDQWVAFRHLQPWMHPLVEELIAALASKGRLAEVVDEARRVLTRAAEAED